MWVISNYKEGDLLILTALNYRNGLPPSFCQILTRNVTRLQVALLCIPKPHLIANCYALVAVCQRYGSSRQYAAARLAAPERRDELAAVGYIQGQ